MPTIKILDKEYTLPEGITIIGRGEDADITIDTVGLSRQHVRFNVTGDRVTIEDLGSKNGTFVNSARITAVTTISSKDQVKLGNTPVVLAAETGPAAPAPAAASAAPAAQGPKAVKRPRPAGRRTKERIKQAVIAAVLVIAALVAYSYIKNYVSPELKEARAALEAAAGYLDAALVTDDIDANAGAVAELAVHKARLKQIGPEFAIEYRRAGDLTAAADELAGRLETRNAFLRREQEADQALAQVLTPYTVGAAAARDTLFQLELLASRYAGTAAAQKAVTACIEVRAAILKKEQAQVAETAAAALVLAGQERYLEGLAAAQAGRDGSYSQLPASELRPLEEVMTRINAMARERLETQIRTNVSRAAAGDCEALKKELQQLYTAIGIEELREVLTKGLAQIDAVRAERIAQARALLAKEIESLDLLDKKRMYRDAAAKCEALIGRVAEQELKNELAVRQKEYGLMASAKRSITAMGGGEAGVTIAGMGLVKNLTEEAVEIEIEGRSMAVGWDKVRDDEFLALLGNALEAAPTAEGFMVYGLILLKRGNLKDADIYLARAFQESPAIAELFPEVFEASRQRAAQKAEETAMKKEAERKAAELARLPRNHEGRILPRMPRITAPILFDTREADQVLEGMQVFPKDNPWNEDISALPVHPNSENLINTIGAEKPFQYNLDMAFVIVPPDQPKIKVALTSAGESDPGPYPVPDIAPIEGCDDQFVGEGDRHMFVVDPVNGKLFEFYHAYRLKEGGWNASCEATFDLTANKWRPAGWTSSDAAGLSVFAATVRYDECDRGMVEHAMRFTVERTRRAYIHPARHHASVQGITDLNVPAMGQRLRLKADVNLAGFPKHAKAIALGLKKYGMFVADNGGDWRMSIAPDKRISGLQALTRLKGSDFEVVDTEGLTKEK